MTQDEFVAKYHDELFGMVIHALTRDDDGPVLARRIKAGDARIEEMLRLMYNELIPPNRPEAKPSAAPVKPMQQPVKRP